ncbi:two-partner secretion domain-containing protein [Nitrospira sp. M1]
MARNHVFHCCQEPFLKLLLSVGIWTIFNMIPNYSFSQTPPPVTIDGSLQGLTGSGNNSGAQALSGQDITVTREMGLVRGSNLFHSFGRFNVPTDGSVTFTGPNSIQNILSRVTGNDISNIDGTLASEIAGADLYLMNPNGIIFGEKASLDVKGSFYATTANNIELEDGEFFNAVNDKKIDTLLTTSPPEKFGFLGNNQSGSIVVEGSSLAVPQGKTIALVGGDISITGAPPIFPGFPPPDTLKSSQGQILIISLENEQNSTSVPSLTSREITSGQAGGSITIKSAALNTFSSSDSGGSLTDFEKNQPLVVIRGGQLTMNDTVISVGDSAPNRKTADVTIDMTETVTVRKSQVLSQSEGSGEIGLTSISAGETLSINETRVSTSGFLENSNVSTQSENGIAFKASTLMIQNSEILASSTGKDGDQGPSIILEGNSISVTEGSTIASSTLDESNAGNITIEAIEEVLISDTSALDSNTLGQGNGGDVSVKTQRFTLLDGGTIQSVTRDNGNAGNIFINAEESFTISGEVSDESSVIPSRILTQSAQLSQGQAGVIEIDTGDFVLIDGARVDTSTGGSGTGGSVTVKAKSILISGNTTQINSGTIGKGRGGEIKLDAYEKIEVTDGSTLSSLSNDAGNAGNIKLDAGSSIHLKGSRITTEAENSLGGNITFNTTNFIEIVNSQIATKVNIGSGAAGSITLDPQFIIVQNSSINTSAISGNGGDVTFVADSAVLIDPFSSIDTSSRFGGSGTVDIRAPIQNLGETIAPLPEEILKVSGLFTASCAAQKGGKFSSFVKKERDGISQTARSFLTSPLYAPSLRSEKIRLALNKEKLFKRRLFHPTIERHTSYKINCSF